jgi:retron-type reverse transcriptase
MKRRGNLMPFIADIDNLGEAFLWAVRGKSGQQEVKLFRENLTAELQALSLQLTDGTFHFSPYRLFTIYDRKKRRICAAPFRDRVVMHAMMRICHPIFEGYQTADSFASRPDRGTYKALARAREFTQRYEWFLKLDVCKYFDNIDHRVLMHQLRSLIKDAALLAYFEQQIAGYQAAPGRGLAIGNLTSQYFANHYLSVADHYLREVLKAPAVVRYMDDVLVFARDVAMIKAIESAYRSFLSSELHLQLHPAIINATRCGVPFLGYVVFPRRIRLATASRRRFVHKVQAVTYAWQRGQLSDADCRMRLSSAYAYALQADTRGLRQRLGSI